MTLRFLLDNNDDSFVTTKLYLFLNTKFILKYYIFSTQKRSLLKYYLIFPLPLFTINHW